MWTTQEELRYLSGIGKHSNSAIVTDQPRADMLRPYLRAASLRSDWGFIDPTVVIAAAVGMLAELTG